MAKPQNISETTTEPHLVRARVKVRGGGRGRVGVATRVGVKARARVRSSCAGSRWAQRSLVRGRVRGSG